MLKACLDTSTRIASFVLFKDDEALVTLSEECHKGASKLLPFINEKVQEAGVKINEVNHWKIGIGPGSFTGMRVGIAYIKGICYGSEATFEGVNSGYGFLYSMLEKSSTLEKVTVLHDGRRQEAICNTFEKSNGTWLEKGTEVVSILDLVNSTGKFGAYVSNMNSELFPDELRDSIFFVDALNAGYFAKVKDRLGLNMDEMDSSCEPIYVRPAVFVNPVSK